MQTAMKRTHNYLNRNKIYNGLFLWCKDLYQKMLKSLCKGAAFPKRQEYFMKDSNNISLLYLLKNNFWKQN